MCKIRRGDEVVVIAGKNKNKRGVVLRVIGHKLIMDGVGFAIKHQKPNPASGIQGGFVDKHIPIHISNVAIFNSLTKVADRISFKEVEYGRKVRVYRSNGETIGA